MEQHSIRNTLILELTKDEIPVLNCYTILKYVSVASRKYYTLQISQIATQDLKDESLKRLFCLENVNRTMSNSHKSQAQAMNDWRVS